MWKWYLALIIFGLIYVLICLATLNPEINRPDLFWIFYAVYDASTSFGLLILHIINGRKFVQKAKSFRLMYERPKHVGFILYLVSFVLLLRTASIVGFFLHPIHFEPWSFFILGYYIVLELVPTYLIYRTILMQRKAQNTKMIGDSMSGIDSINTR